VPYNLLIELGGEQVDCSIYVPIGTLDKYTSPFPVNIELRALALLHTLVDGQEDRHLDDVFEISQDPLKLGDRVFTQ
jgi:hypothetical protein